MYQLVHDYDSILHNSVLLLLLQYGLRMDRIETALCSIFETGHTIAEHGTIAIILAACAFFHAC